MMDGGKSNTQVAVRSLGMDLRRRPHTHGGEFLRSLCQVWNSVVKRINFPFPSDLSQLSRGPCACRKTWEGGSLDEAQQARMGVGNGPGIF